MPDVVPVPADGYGAAQRAVAVLEFGAVLDRVASDSRERRAWKLLMARVPPVGRLRGEGSCPSCCQQASGPTSELPGTPLGVIAMFHSSSGCRTMGEHAMENTQAA